MVRVSCHAREVRATPITRVWGRQPCRASSSAGATGRPEPVAVRLCKLLLAVNLLHQAGQVACSGVRLSWRWACTVLGDGRSQQIAAVWFWAARRIGFACKRHKRPEAKVVHILTARSQQHIVTQLRLMVGFQ